MKNLAISITLYLLLTSLSSVFASNWDFLPKGAVYCANTYNNHPSPPLFGSALNSQVVDINYPNGKDEGVILRAPEKGTVSKIYEADKGWGNAITFASRDGSEVFFLAHLGKFGKTGNVYPGDDIGTIGTTGSSTSPHLHIQRQSDKNNVSVVLSGNELQPAPFGGQNGDVSCTQDTPQYTSLGQDYVVESLLSCSKTTINENTKNASICKLTTRYKSGYINAFAGKDALWLSLPSNIVTINSGVITSLEVSHDLSVKISAVTAKTTSNKVTLLVKNRTAGTPVITAVDFPSSIPGDNQNITGKVHFTDSNAGVISAQFNVVEDTCGGCMKSFSVTPDPPVVTVKTGSFSFYMFCHTATGFQWKTQITLKDKDGNVSDPYTLPVRCAVPG